MRHVATLPGTQQTTKLVRGVGKCNGGHMTSRRCTSRKIAHASQYLLQRLTSLGRPFVRYALLEHCFHAPPSCGKLDLNSRAVRLALTKGLEKSSHSTPGVAGTAPAGGRGAQPRRLRSSRHQVAHVDWRGVVVGRRIEQVSRPALVLGDTLLNELPRERSTQVADRARDGGRREALGAAKRLEAVGVQTKFGKRDG